MLFIFVKVLSLLPITNVLGTRKKNHLHKQTSKHPKGQRGVKNMSIVNSGGDFLEDLLALMRTKEFKVFQRNHMGNPYELKTSLVYFELHRAINTIYMDLMGEAIPDSLSREILRSVMRRSEYRKPLVGIVMEYLDNGTRSEDLCRRVETILNQKSGRNLLE